MISDRPATPLSRTAAALFVVWAALVLWFSLRPMTGLLPGGGHIDKLEHFLAYAGLTALGFAALRGRSIRLLLSVLAFGVTVEGLQAVLPTGRTGSVLDALANTAGAGSAWAVWAWAERRRR